MFDKFKDFIGIDDNYDDYEDEELYFDEEDETTRSSSREAYTDLLEKDDKEDKSLTYESGYSSSTSSSYSPTVDYDSQSYSSSQNTYQRPSRRGDNIVSMTENNYSSRSSMRISIQEPLDYEKDAPSVIDDILDKKVVVLNLEMVDADMRQRIFDFVSGAVYALDGTVERVTKGIFVISPKGVQVDSSVTEQISDGNYNQL